MEGGDFINEVDCNSFFDQMDDLVEFPTESDSGIFSGGSSDLSDIWSDPLPVRNHFIFEIFFICNFIYSKYAQYACIKELY